MATPGLAPAASKVAASGIWATAQTVDDRAEQRDDQQGEHGGHPAQVVRDPPGRDKRHYQSREENAHAEVALGQESREQGDNQPEEIGRAHV